MSEPKVAHAKRCCAQVPWRGENFFRSSQCTNRAKVEREGNLYCGIHDPVKRAIIRARNYEKQKADFNRRLSLYAARIASKNKPKS